jgi:hypothetical protein
MASVLRAWHSIPSFSRAHHEFIDASNIMKILHDGLDPLSPTTANAEATRKVCWNLFWYVFSQRGCPKHFIYYIFYSFLCARCFLEEDSHDSHPTNLQRKMVDFITDDLKKMTDILAKKKPQRYIYIILSSESYQLNSVIFFKSSDHTLLAHL